jgi:hypothetical protein
MKRINLRRASRTVQPVASAEPASDPRTERAVKHLIASERARARPSDDELDRLAEVKPADIDRAVDLWDLAQQSAGTGLEGLLDAKEEVS